MRLLFILLLMAGEAQGQIKGIDCLACMSPNFERQTCTRFLQAFKGSIASHTAILWHVFGENKTCLRRFLKLKNPVIEIHPTCGACRRHPQYYGRLLPPGDGRTVRQITALAVRHPEAQWLLSLELEDNFTNEEAQKILAHIVEIWPFPTVRNPIFGHDSIGANYLELHGSEARCESGSGNIADLDGSKLDNFAIAEWLNANSSCSFLRLWFCELQGTCAGYRNISHRRYRWPRKVDLKLIR